MSSELKNQSSFLHHQTQNAKTILITNNYTQNGGVVRGGDGCSGGSGGKVIGSGSATNSITILTGGGGGGNARDAERETGAGTVVLDRINICINNHYDSTVAQLPVVKIKTEKMEEQSYGMMPPANNQNFKQGDDVLVMQKDGRYYLGTIALAATNQCLVQFDDNTKKWATYSEVKRFGTSKEIEDDAPLCVVCKVKEENRVVEVCERCGRGYHQYCTKGNFGTNGVWFCRR